MLTDCTMAPKVLVMSVLYESDRRNQWGKKSHKQLAVGTFKFTLTNMCKTFWENDWRDFYIDYGNQNGNF